MLQVRTTRRSLWADYASGPRVAIAREEMKARRLFQEVRVVRA